MSQGTDPQDNYPGRIGSTMTMLAWVLLLGVLTILFGKVLDNQDNPNTDVRSLVRDGITEVMLEQNHAGHYVARAGLNGVPVDVIIDTGATDVSVPAGIAEKTGLVRGPAMTVTTANGSVPVYLTRIDTLQLGEITLHDVRASINPHMQEDFVLLGMSFLERLEFTQSGGTMTLRQAGNGPE